MRENAPLTAYEPPWRVIAPTTKQRIEQEARRAASDGNTRRDACAYAYSTPEGQHWTAVFLLAGGKLG